MCVNVLFEFLQNQRKNRLAQPIPKGKKLLAPLKHGCMGLIPGIDKNLRAFFGAAPLRPWFFENPQPCSATIENNREKAGLFHGGDHYTFRSGDNSLGQPDFPPLFCVVHFQNDRGFPGRVRNSGLYEKKIRSHLHNANV